MLTGKTIVITGASRGIGRAIAVACAHAGARMGLNYRTNLADIACLAEELQSLHGQPALPLCFDVRDEAAMRAACEPLLADGGAIDGWVNNAGVNRPGLLLTQTPEMIAEQIDVNLAGPIHGARVVLPHMMARRRGSIVNIGSIASHHVAPGQAVYAATKGALAALTRALAFEYGRKGIRVNCVEPGPVETEMFQQTQALVGDALLGRIPLRRFGKPEDIADLVVFLLSDQAAFLTGGIFTADGGYSLG